MPAYFDIFKRNQELYDYNTGLMMTSIYLLGENGTVMQRGEIVWTKDISLPAEQPIASCIAILHKYCCYTKYGGYCKKSDSMKSLGYITDMSKCHSAGVWSMD